MADPTLRDAQSLDYGYLEEALRQWASRFSNVLAFETHDPVRRRQIKAFLVANFEGAEIYLFKRWEGLLRWRGGNRGGFAPVTRPAQGAYDSLITGALEQSHQDLTEALHYLDARLKSAQTVAILEELEGFRSDLKEQRLLDALRCWAHHPELTLQGSLVVLIAGDVSQVVDELTTQRVVVFRPPLASAEERLYVVREITEALGITLPEQEQRLIIESTRGLNLHQLGSVLREAWEMGGRHGLDMEYLRKLKARVVNHIGFLELEEPAFGFEAIGGYEPVKELIRTRVILPLQQAGRAAHFGYTPARGLLFFGPPGTGKTVFARSLAKELGMPFINLHLESLFAPELGRSGQLFAQAIRLIEQMAPCLVFIDELDRFTQRHTVHDSAGEETRRVFNQVLAWLGSKERQAILVGTTNRPEDLDPALIRPGRIDCLVPVLYPDCSARRQILEAHLGLRGSGSRPPALALNPSELHELLETLADRTVGMSGAELEELVRRAKAYGFASREDKLTQEHFLRALGNIKVDLERRMEAQRTYIEWWLAHADAPVDVDLLHAVIGSNDP